MYLDISISQMV